MHYLICIYYDVTEDLRTGKGWVVKATNTEGVSATTFWKRGREARAYARLVRMLAHKGKVIHAATVAASAMALTLLLVV
tara:strand:- start:321 stop:557 length:237 start_codon:yes stop_codon:yes gene_type:complete